MIRTLHHLDQQATLFLNSLYCPASDQFWMLVTEKKVWYLLYLFAIVMLIRRLGWKKALVVVLSVVLTIGLVDQLSNLVKDSVARLRPCYDTWMISHNLHQLEPRGGFYGFFSAHAANHFGIATTLVMGFRNDRRLRYRGLAAGAFIWASLIALSRVFVGKHYLGDVLVGALAGLLIGYLAGLAARWVINRFLTTGE